ncbi:hypothetical protein [Streptomyces sp. G45]|uniref:hypothetical protein n=1 Tax=Streptomyces sp. G45 TaxID=3406627 RepID=UPI003C271847
MDELVRFVLQRPAQQPETSEVKPLRPAFVPPGADRPTAVGKALALVASERFLRTPDPLKYAAAARAVAALLAPRPLEADHVRDVVRDHAGKPADQVVADPRFAAEEELLADSLVAMKLLSDSSGADAPGLAELARGYDAIRAAAGPGECVRLRPLVQPGFADPQAAAREPGFAVPRAAPEQSGTAAAREPGPGKDRGEGDPPDRGDRGAERPAPAADPARTPAAPGSDPAPLRDLDAALAALGALRADSFHGPVRTTHAPADQQELTLTHLRTERPWTLTEEALGALPGEVRRTLAHLGADPAHTPLPALLDAVHGARAEALRAAALARLPTPVRAHVLGQSVVEWEADGDTAAAAGDMDLPRTRGNIRPAGVGDLLVVKQHTLRYEGGELAHVENVLARERLSRETRRLARTEATLVQESETTRTEERDQQTTDRFSLRREASDTVKRDAEFKAGVAVTARYGPFIEVKAHADHATRTASESSTRQSVEFGKDLVNRSVSRVVERVLERRSVTTVEEFEEKYAHGLDNTAGSQHVTGVYQWVDKVVHTQVYNYGKRQLFDVTLPEPAAAYLAAQRLRGRQSQTLVKPPEFPLRADEVDEGNYLVWGHLYDVTDLEAPPPAYRFSGKSVTAALPQEPLLSSGTHDLAIEDGYRAKYLQGSFGTAVKGTDVDLWIVAGKKQHDLTNQPVPPFDLDGETGTLPVAYFSRNLAAFALSLEVFCERTERALRAWQLRTHGKLTQGYLAKVKAYEQALAEARAAAGTPVPGGNPGLNRKLVATELRKQCLMLLTGQHFDGFGAVEESAEGHPQPDLGRSAEQMPYVRFFEQAFEWENLAYFCYPYFWGAKSGWQGRMLLDDADPDFADFLRAGAARVVFPVRPGFESAVVHFLETGEVWNGGAPRTSPARCTCRSSRRSRRPRARRAPRRRRASRGWCGCRRRWCGCAPRVICPPGRRSATSGSPRTEGAA